MTDRIFLDGVQAFGHHGVLEHEKRDGQPFVVDVVLELDLAPAGRSDDLAATVSYAEVAADVVARITGPSFDLVERLAEVIADDTLLRPLVDAVEVTVHKPEAPVGQPFSDVGVRVRRERGTPVVIALGANLGDAQGTLQAAVTALAATPGLRLRSVSRLALTEPVGGPEQDAYLNAVVVGETTLAPARLLERLHAIEAEHGRTREVRWGARTLDLDLIQVGRPGTVGEVTSADPALTLAHPRAHERAFVLVPWAQADPAAVLRLPEGDVRGVAEVVAGLDTAGVQPGPTWEPSLEPPW